MIEDYVARELKVEGIVQSLSSYQSAEKKPIEDQDEVLRALGITNMRLIELFNVIYSLNYAYIVSSRLGVYYVFIGVSFQ